jgi:beta-lactamase regulating signal transducer with metallopeptidase domain
MLLTSIVMSAIILVVLAVYALFPKAFPAKLRYMTWIVILIGLVIPLRPVIGDGFVDVPLPASAVQYEVLQAGSGNERAPATSEAASAGPPVSPALVGVLIWGMVAAMIFAYHMQRYARFLKTVRRWGKSVKDEKVLSVLRSEQRKMGLDHKNFDVKICDFISSSMLTGFFRPMILLPQRDFEADEPEFIFRHELIHYKRRDLPVKLLSVIAVSLHWFNPLVYLMCAAAQTDGEASCDEAVLRDTDQEDRRFYAEVIIGMISGKNTSGTMLSTCFYGGKYHIKKRLDSIMDTTRRTKSPAFAALAVVTALTVFSGSVFALTAQAPPFQAPPAETPPAANPIAPHPPSASPDAEITAERAREIALAKVGGGAVIECDRDYENGRPVYEIEIVYGNTKHEMDIDAITGAISGYSTEKDSSHNDSHHDDD